MRRTASRWASALFLLGLFAAAPARGDDWPQFRHDAGRSATSSDRVKLPLTEVWTWSTRLNNGHSPLFNSVVWKGRVFFTACEGQKRYLICADAKKGSVKWRQPLEAAQLKFALSDTVGPAVSESGIVYVYDWLGAGAGGQATTSSGAVRPVDSFAVRTFSAMDGRPGTYYPLAAMGANGVLPRLSLLHTPVGQEIRPVPPTYVGCPP